MSTKFEVVNFIQERSLNIKGYVLETNLHKTSKNAAIQLKLRFKKFGDKKKKIYLSVVINNSLLIYRPTVRIC